MSPNGCTASDWGPGRHRWRPAAWLRTVPTVAVGSACRPGNSRLLGYPPAVRHPGWTRRRGWAASHPAQASGTHRCHRTKRTAPNTPRPPATGPQEAQHIDRLLGARPAGAEMDVDRGGFSSHRAQAHGDQLKPPGRQHVERGELLREYHGVPVGQQKYRRAKQDPVGAGGHESEQRQWVSRRRCGRHVKPISGHTSPPHRMARMRGVRHLRREGGPTLTCCRGHADHSVRGDSTGVTQSSRRGRRLATSRDTPS